MFNKARNNDPPCIAVQGLLSFPYGLVLIAKQIFKAANDFVDVAAEESGYFKETKCFKKMQI